jgi:hypothetical protein
MEAQLGHLVPEGVWRGDLQHLHSPDQVPLNGFEIVELSIEMARQQQDAIFELALSSAQGTFLEIRNGKRGAGDNCCNKQRTAEYKPDQRISPIKYRYVAIDGARWFGSFSLHCPPPLRAGIQRLNGESLCKRGYRILKVGRSAPMLSRRRNALTPGQP